MKFCRLYIHNTNFKYFVSSHVYLLSLLKCKCEVVSPVLFLQTEPVKVVRVEDVDESAEREAIIPAGGEVCHGDLKYQMCCHHHNMSYSYWIILDSCLNPHQDHLLGS